MPQRETAPQSAELGETHIRDSLEIRSTSTNPNPIPNTRLETKLQDFPEHLLGVDTVKKGVQLGRGGMAIVYNGKYGTIPVALKMATHSLDTLLNEAAIIMKLRHPNVVQAYGIWKDRKERVFMVFTTTLALLFVLVNATATRLHPRT